MLRIAICDDDKRFTGELEKIIIKECNELKTAIETEIFFDGKTLLDDIDMHRRYDIIFIDIEMRQLDGITTVRKIRENDNKVIIIYVSAYESYCKELFEVNTFRFLQKPIEESRVRLYFREAYKMLQQEKGIFQFSFNKKVYKIHLEDIIYFESRNRVITVFLSDGSTEVFYGKLNDVEEKVKSESCFFLRIHQSYLVNYDYIFEINFSDVVIYANNKKIKLKISEDRQKKIRKQLCEQALKKAVLM